MLSYFKLEWDPKKIKEDMKIKAKEKVIPSNDDSDGRMSTLPIMQVKSKAHQNNKYYLVQIVLIRESNSILKSVRMLYLT